MQIKTFNQIAPAGLEQFPETYTVSDTMENEDGILVRSGVLRICIIHKNIPAMLANITSTLSRDGANVENLSNKSRGDIAYTILDLGTEVDSSVLDDLHAINGIIRVRVLH